MKKIGILTSGGDAPGMNAAIRACVRAASSYGLQIVGIENGYLGILAEQFIPLNRKSVSDISSRGGTLLGSARLPGFKEEAVQDEAVRILKKHEIDGIVCIGGDGTYKGALALSRKGIACIALPGTIDNDINSTDYTIGFDTALNTIIENVDKLKDTSASHHRCSIVEVMGNHCGDLALFAGICCGAEIIITPESGYNEAETIELLQYYEASKQKKHAIIIISEKICDVHQLAKVVSERTGFSGRATVLGHIQRGGSPTPMDRLLAARMGDKAIERLYQGFSNECIASVNNEIVAIDIEEALAMEKVEKVALFEMHKRLV